MFLNNTVTAAIEPYQNWHLRLLGGQFVWQNSNCQRTSFNYGLASDECSTLFCHAFIQARVFSADISLSHLVFFLKLWKRLLGVATLCPRIQSSTPLPRSFFELWNVFYTCVNRINLQQATILSSALSSQPEIWLIINRSIPSAGSEKAAWLRFVSLIGLYIIKM